VTRSRKRWKTFHSFASGPDESLQNIAFHVAGRSGKTDDIAAMIDVGRRVPIFGSQIPKAGDCASVPKNGVAGGSASDCLVAVSGDADNLPAVIDCRRRSRRIAGRRGQLADCSASCLPDDRAKLQNLIVVNAGRDWSLLVVRIS